MEGVDPKIEKLYSPAVIKRFLANVKPGANGCLEWAGALNDDGYGKISVGGREDQEKVRVHRWVLQSVLGVILPPEILACHGCDNRACIHPGHIFPGTQQDNMDDMVAKGRSVTVRNRMAFTDEEVLEIREKNLPLKEIMERFGVSKATASYARSGKTYSHL